MGGFGECLFVLEVGPCMYGHWRNSGKRGLNYGLSKQQEAVTNLSAKTPLLLKYAQIQVYKANSTMFLPVHRTTSSKGLNWKVLFQKERGKIMYTSTKPGKLQNTVNVKTNGQPPELKHEVNPVGTQNLSHYPWASKRPAVRHHHSHRCTEPDTQSLKRPHPRLNCMCTNTVKAFFQLIIWLILWLYRMESSRNFSSVDWSPVFY